MQTNGEAKLTLPKRRLFRRFFSSVNLKRKKIWRRRRQERLLDNTSRFLQYNLHAHLSLTLRLLAAAGAAAGAVAVAAACTVTAAAAVAVAAAGGGAAAGAVAGGGAAASIAAAVAFALLRRLCSLPFCICAARGVSSSMGWLAIGLRPAFFFAGGVTGAGGRMAGTRSTSPWLG